MPICEMAVSSILVEQQIKFPSLKVQTQLSRDSNIVFLDSIGSDFKRDSKHQQLTSNKHSTAHVLVFQFYKG